MTALQHDARASLVLLSNFPLSVSEPGVSDCDGILSWESSLALLSRTLACNEVNSCGAQACWHQRAMSSQFVCHTLPLLHHGAIQEPLYSLFSKIDCNHLRMGLISYLYRTFTIVCAHATALQQRDWHAPCCPRAKGQSASVQLT